MSSDSSPKRPAPDYDDIVAAKTARSFDMATHLRHLLPETELSSFLYHERRRAERNRKALVVILIKIHAFTIGRMTDRSLRALRSQLSASIRATDAFGWYETGSSIGVVFTEVPLENKEPVSELLLTKIITIVRGCMDREVATSVPLAIQVLDQDLSRDELNPTADTPDQTRRPSRNEEKAVTEKLPSRLWRPEPIT